MAAGINIALSSSQTGLTMVAKIMSAGTQVGSNISLTESSVLGYYYGSDPVTIANGSYTVIFQTNGGVTKGSGNVSYVNNMQVDFVQSGELNAIAGLQSGIPAVNRSTSRVAGNVGVDVANYGSEPTTVTRQ